jgi:hypothetical protein
LNSRLATGVQVRPGCRLKLKSCTLITAAIQGLKYSMSNGSF